MKDPEATGFRRISINDLDGRPSPLPNADAWHAGELDLPAGAFDGNVRPEFRRAPSKAFSSHEAKLFFAHLALAIFNIDKPVPTSSELFADAAATASATNADKFRGLYVDFVDGQLRLPSEVDEVSARTLTADVAGLLNIVEEPYTAAHLLDAVAAQGDDRAVINALAARFINAFETDEESAFSYLHHEMASMQHDTYDWSTLIGEGRTIPDLPALTWLPD